MPTLKKPLEIRYVDPASLKPAARNPRIMPPAEMEALQRALDRWGFVDPIVVRAQDKRIIGGHQRVEAAVAMGMTEIPVVYVNVSKVDAMVLNEALNRITGRWNEAELALHQEEIRLAGGDLSLTGFTDDEIALLAGTGHMTASEGRRKLTERFIVPPFSVLDARQGYWQDRKRAWLALGVAPQEGRASDLVGFGGAASRRQAGSNPKLRKPFDPAAGRRGDMISKSVDRANWGSYQPGDTGWTGSGSSIFDPVLAELACRWFCPPGGAVLDPFAGESTKGIVAEYLGYQYTGIEIRPEQVEANVAQADALHLVPQWIFGDAEQLDGLLPAGAQYDLIFTSPPYYDLEIYSQADASALPTYPEFMAFYWRVFAQAVARLRDNRFVVVKVGEIRDKAGAYRNFVGDNMAGFVALGLHYYNEATFITPVGSLPIRVSSQFTHHRKLGKGHQNVLVFFKGELQAIPANFPDTIEAGDVEAQGDAGGTAAYPPP